MITYRTPDGLEFEWGEKKDRSNRKDHGFSFPKAATVFVDSLSLVAPDDKHSIGEVRYNIIGRSASDELLAVTYTERHGRIRIISAREATPRERRKDEEGN